MENLEKTLLASVIDADAVGLHYVPLKSDLTDLYDVLTFFRGHDGLAKSIAEEGKAWSQTFWRREDMVSYQFR